MKMKAAWIQTPIGKLPAPLHPTFPDRLADCHSDEELFALVQPGDFIDPDAWNEVNARDLVSAYYRWRASRGYPLNPRERMIWAAAYAAALRHAANTLTIKQFDERGAVNAMEAACVAVLKARDTLPLLVEGFGHEPDSDLVQMAREMIG